LRGPSGTRCRKCDKLLSSENSRHLGLCYPCERSLVVHCSRCGRILNHAAAKMVGLCPSCFKRFREAARRRLRLARLRKVASMPKRRTHIKLQRSQAADVVYHIVVPRYLVEELGLVKGDVLRVRAEGTRIIYERDR